MLFLSKFLPVFFYPLGAALTLGGFGLLLTWTRFRGLGRAALVLALLVLWISSMPAFANWVYADLEGRYPPVALENLPQADVAILLGAALGQPLPPRVTADLGEPADRVLQAARLFRAGKVRVVLVSGGNLPWETTVAPEAQLVGGLLAEFGVPREAVILEGESRNTFENALRSREIWRGRGFQTGLLVTSAAHMPRALATFRRAGLPMIPAAADVRVRYPIYESVLDFLPDVNALALTTSWVKEWVGLLVYRLRGWA